MPEQAETGVRELFVSKKAAVETPLQTNNKVVRLYRRRLLPVKVENDKKMARAT